MQIQFLQFKKKYYKTSSFTPLVHLQKNYTINYLQNAIRRFQQMPFTESTYIDNFPSKPFKTLHSTKGFSQKSIFIQTNTHHHKSFFYRFHLLFAPKKPFSIHSWKFIPSTSFNKISLNIAFLRAHLFLLTFCLLFQITFQFYTFTI